MTLQIYLTYSVKRHSRPYRNIWIHLKCYLNVFLIRKTFTIALKNKDTQQAGKRLKFTRNASWKSTPKASIVSFIIFMWVAIAKSWNRGKWLNFWGAAGKMAHDGMDFHGGDKWTRLRRTEIQFQTITDDQKRKYTRLHALVYCIKVCPFLQVYLYDCMHYYYYMLWNDDMYVYLYYSNANLTVRTLIFAISKNVYASKSILTAI